LAIEDKQEMDKVVYSMLTSPYPNKSNWYEYDAECIRCDKKETVVEEEFTAEHPAAIDPHSSGYEGYVNKVVKPEE